MSNVKSRNPLDEIGLNQLFRADTVGEDGQYEEVDEDVLAEEDGYYDEDARLFSTRRGGNYNNRTNSKHQPSSSPNVTNNGSEAGPGSGATSTSGGQPHQADTRSNGTSDGAGGAPPAVSNHVGLLPPSTNHEIVTSPLRDHLRTTLVDGFGAGSAVGAVRGAATSGATGGPDGTSLAGGNGPDGDFNYAAAPLELQLFDQFRQHQPVNVSDEIAAMAADAAVMQQDNEQEHQNQMMSSAAGGSFYNSAQHHSGGSLSTNQQRERDEHEVEQERAAIVQEALEKLRSVLNMSSAVLSKSKMNHTQQHQLQGQAGVPLSSAANHASAPGRTSERAVPSLPSRAASGNKTGD
ncbi:unnamed protein product, partial [Amoebophrya sp. A120]|eukprot:GSA120T00023721001.1